jgi:hypothetical protein
MALKILAFLQYEAIRRGTSQTTSKGLASRVIIIPLEHGIIYAFMPIFMQDG